LATPLTPDNSRATTPSITLPKKTKGQDMSTKSDYEMEKEANIAKNKALLAKLNLDNADDVFGKFPKQ